MYSQAVAAKLVGSKLTPNGLRSLRKAYTDVLETGRSAQLEWVANRIKYNGHWLADKPEEREFDLQFYALYASCWWGLEDPYSASLLDNPKAAEQAKEKGLKTEKLGPALACSISKRVRLADAQYVESMLVHQKQLDADPETFMPAVQYAGRISVPNLPEGIPEVIYTSARRTGKLSALAAAYGESNLASDFLNSLGAPEKYKAFFNQILARSEALPINPAVQIHQSNIKEDIMSNAKPGNLEIKTITFINGTAIDHISDETIYTMIAEREGMIEHYEKMKNRPERLKVSLTKIQAEIDSLVKLVDART